MIEATKKRTRRAARRGRDWGYCPVTGLIRYGERWDAKKAVEHAFHVRAAANLKGEASSNRVVRAFRCEHCRGYHTTTIPYEAWVERQDRAA